MAKEGTGHTADLARWFEIAPQGPTESDQDFRERVGGTLRDRGKIIEAHEALNNCRYDDPDAGPNGPMTGILGALSQASQGVSWGSKGNEQLGDDIAAGIYQQKPKEDPVMMVD